MSDPDLGEMLSSKKPVVLLSDAFWEPKLKEWVPRIRLDELDEEQQSIIEKRLFVVVITPSNISRCSVCGKTITKGTYRMGVPEYDRRGIYGIINRWNHINPCSQKYLKRAIKGFESSLEETERRISEVVSGWSGLPIGIKDDILDLCTRETIADSGEFSIESSEDLVRRSIVETKPTPANLTYELLQFQKEGLAWLCNQERSAARGGILADEMGMGKTIQTISLILEHDTPPVTDRMERGEVVGNNLVVAPVAAVLQWKQEIERFTKPGSLKVHVYHGSKRSKGTTRSDYGGVEIENADVVITTYPTLEAEYRKTASAFKSKCPYCDRSFLKRTLKIHLRYFCGPNSMRTAKQALTERKNEGLKKAMRTLKIGLEEGVDKAKQLEEIARSLPTISNVYREILAKADLLDDESLSSALPWFTSRRSRGETAVKGEEPSASSGRETETKRKAETKTKTAESPDGDGSSLLSLLEWGGLGLPLKSETVKSIRDFLSSIEESRDYLSVRLNLSAEVLDGLIELYGRSRSLRKAELVEKLSLLLGLESVERSGEEARASNSRTAGTSKKRRYEDDLEDDYVAAEESSEDTDESEYDPDSGGGTRVAEETTGDTESEGEEEQILRRLREYSGIFGRSWNRIILDEAHRIKARTTSTAKAIFALKSRGTKWCLTGTPLQNRVGELYSLVRFVGFHPYAYNFCQKPDCDCKQLNYVAHLKYCSFCGHARSCHYSYFNKQIINPIKRYGFSGEGSEALRRLKEEVLDKILLRRTKIQRQEDVRLPPLEIRVISSQLSAPERDFYTSLYQRSKVQFDTYVNQGTVLHNYAHVFDLISRLRQAVDHPYLIVYGKEEREGGDGSETSTASNKVVMPSKSRADSSEDLCYICMDNVSVGERVTSKCKHGFHVHCIRDYIEQAPQEDQVVAGFEQGDDQPMRGVLGCPVCYVPLTVDLNKARKSRTNNDEENDSNDNMESEHMQEQIERELERAEMARQLGIDIAERDLGQEPASQEKGEDILSCVRNKFITRQIKTQGFESSTKIDTLLEEVSRMMLEDPEAKGIVFSQFTNMLDLVSYRLKKANIGCVMLAGSMSILQRNSILYSFNKFPDLKIILISLKAGGEGLNLQVANYVFLLDPWWNPAVELQAFQRAHRIGQKKKVTALRFITKDTIEERMFQLQEKKQLVFDGTVGASSNALNKLNSDDLKFLFQN